MRITTSTVLAGALLAAMAVPASGQIPDSFTNLEVLPDDIDKRELIGVMRGFATGLGVRCTHCHVGEDGPGFEGFDFASDEKAPKRTARAMLKMVRAINDAHLPKAGVTDGAEVECSTCHRGVTKPARLATLLLEIVEDEGAAAAVARYRALRDEHYGSAAYDFSPRTLTEVSETLARSNLDDALTMIRLNLELDPDIAYSRLVEGQILLFRGETEAGFAALQQAVELEPDDPLYRGQLERARAQFGGERPEPAEE